MIEKRSLEISILSIMDRTARQKSNKERGDEHYNWTHRQMEHPTQHQWNTHSRQVHMERTLAQRTCSINSEGLNSHRVCSLITMELEINKRRQFGKFTHMQELNNTCLNNQCSKREVKQKLENTLSENQNTTH